MAVADGKGALDTPGFSDAIANRAGGIMEETRRNKTDQTSAGAFNTHFLTDKLWH